MKFIKNIFGKNKTNTPAKQGNNLPIPSYEQAGLRMGQPQHAGALSVIPLLGADLNNGIEYLAPLSGIKVSKVEGYGNIELANNAAKGLAIVPLHIGYIQHGAQNHALCRSGFLAAGQKMFFKDACCVQASQGGFLAEKEQWFFILPIELRKAALQLRGKVGYDKLWPSITKVNTHHGRKSRGHLDEIVVKMRNDLNIFSNRFETIEGQRGALFFIDGQYAGAEIAPTQAYFQELFAPLLNFCYGPAAFKVEVQKEAVSKETIAPFNVQSLPELKAALQQDREQKAVQLFDAMTKVTANTVELIPEEKFLNLELKTVKSKQLNGQIVVNKEQLVYASVFAEAFAKA